MEQKKFSALLSIIVPQVISLIEKNYGYDDKTAIREFYESAVYELLEEERTKVWHFSPLTLFNMFDEEKQTGSFELPEET